MQTHGMPVDRIIMLPRKYIQSHICGEHHDRDKNCCVNPLKEGRNIINRWTLPQSMLRQLA